MGIQDENTKNTCAIKSKNYREVKHGGSLKNFTLINWYIVYIIVPSVLCSGLKRISEKISADICFKISHHNKHSN